MITITMMRVKGFRAFMDETNFNFDKPMILILGDNHQGKSSMLNAIEWCLFGSDCIGEKSGIRERKNWEIPNRNLSKKPDVYTQVILEDELGNSYTVIRRYISKTKDELEVTLKNDATLKGEDAQNTLCKVLSSSFRDFLTTVYQHQEVIRAILTQEPRERNDAIDRLLGLSDYRNILTGINNSNLKRDLKDLDAKLDSLRQNIKGVRTTVNNVIEDKKQKAGSLNLKENELNENSALKKASKTKEELLKFASEVNLTMADIQLPDKWENLKQFRESVGREIKRFQAEMPDVKRQQVLYTELNNITEWSIKYEQTKKTLDTTNKAYEDFVQKHGDDAVLTKSKTSIEKQIEEKNKELSQVNAKAAVVTKAIDYLKLTEIKNNVCPVCSKETPDLLKHLEREWQEKFEQHVGCVQKQIESLQLQLKEVSDTYKKLSKLKEDVNEASKLMTRVNQNVSEALKREITDKDDTGAMLAKEISKIRNDLSKLEQAVKSKLKTLDSIVFYLEQIQLINDVIEFEQKKKVVEEIIQSMEYKKMEELKTQLATLIEQDIKDICHAISKASHEEAQSKVAAASNKIDKYFRSVTNNPAVSKIDFSLTTDARNLNSYEFKDQKGKDLTPVLSQGDLNALALSIFLGMACSDVATHPFNFIMLDDPSQSLGSSHKAKFVEVLEDVLENRMIILSTTDKELQDLILSPTVTKKKRKYIFSNWTPEQGPSIQKE